MTASITREPVESQLQFLTTAVQSEPKGRLTLWNALEGDSRDVRVRRALLQSVPGHPAYDPDAARAAMRELMPAVSDGTAALLAARIAEVDQIGLCYHKKKDYSKALVYYRKASDFSPKDSFPLLNSGYCLEKLGREKEAVRFYKAALQVDPSNEKAKAELLRFGEGDLKKGRGWPQIQGQIPIRQFI